MSLDLDGFLMKGFYQPFSDWFHKYTGKNCFFLATAFLCLDIILCVGLILVGFHVDIGGVLCWIIMWKFVQDLTRKCEKKWEDQNLSTTLEKNLIPKKESPEDFMRIIWLGIMMLGLFVLVWGWVGGLVDFRLLIASGVDKIIYLSCFYFATCKPPPPDTEDSMEQAPCAT